MELPSLENNTAGLQKHYKTNRSYSGNQAFWKVTIIRILPRHNLCICLYVLFISG